MVPALTLHVLVAALSAQPAKEPDIGCTLTGSYIGNAISPVFTLKIGGAPKREWTYSHTDDMFGTLKPARANEHRGTYEIDGDLAIFTGALGEKAPAIRFGLNFGFPDGKVAFDRFFPDAKGTFSYSRKWFRQKDKEWHPVEERRLTLTLPAGELPETAEIGWKGQRVRWDANGKRSEEPIDVTFRYKRAQTDWYAPEKPVERKWEWLPGQLIFERAQKKVVAITWSDRYIGDLRGFNPGAAEPPGGP